MAYTLYGCPYEWIPDPSMWEGGYLRVRKPTLTEVIRERREEWDIQHLDTGGEVVSKVARELAEGIEETLIAGSHPKHASHVLGVIPKSELEEFIDVKLAPTLALMDRLAAECENAHAIMPGHTNELRKRRGSQTLHCSGCNLITDYEAWEKEQG